MQAPFAEFAVPDPAYLVFLAAGTTGVLALLYAIGPAVKQQTVLAMVPWMITGAALHVFHNLGAATSEFVDVNIYPPVVEPLFAAPAVYVTTFIAMGTIWVMAEILGSTTTTKDSTHRYLGWIGLGIMLTLVGLLIWHSTDTDVFSPSPILPILIVILTGVLTFVVYMLLGAWRTYVIAEARHVGALVLFAHLLDGVSTAVGYDVLGVGERSVVPARIMEFSADLPTAQYIGAGWLFLVVKMLLAIVIVVAFADYVREKPSEGNLLFAVVTAVGLGPAMNNLFLFYLGMGG